MTSPNGVQILDFDAANGQISYDTNVGGVNAVDAEWSADGSKLYISTGADGRILQYNTDTGTLTNIPALANANGTYGLKLGPDGNIYYLYGDAANEYKLGRILYADSAANLIDHETALFNDANFGNQQFSETAPGVTPPYAISFKQVGMCANNPVQLIPEYPEGTPQPDSVVWYLGDQKFVGTSPSFTPTEATPVGGHCLLGWRFCCICGQCQCTGFSVAGAPGAGYHHLSRLKKLF